MLAINYTTARNNLKTYLDEAILNGETVIITRNNNESAALISLDEYNELQKQLRNAEYLRKIDKGIAQLERGEGQIHDLIEIDNE